MSGELVPTGAALPANADARREALEQLTVAAETAATPAEAREVMLKAKVLSELLPQMKGSYEEAWLASKASVLAARRLGLLLMELSTELVYSRKIGVGPQPSERGRAMQELDIGKSVVTAINRLATIPNPDFQRYIQTPDRLLSVNGALIACGKTRRYISGDSSSQIRRKRAGVKLPRNPSVDEAYSLIVRALGHLSGAASRGGGSARTSAISRAMDALYEAEDTLKPYRAGYGEKH